MFRAVQGGKASALAVQLQLHATCATAASCGQCCSVRCGGLITVLAMQQQRSLQPHMPASALSVATQPTVDGSEMTPPNLMAPQNKICRTRMYVSINALHKSFMPAVKL
jgi:hypothetical protein